MTGDTLYRKVNLATERAEFVEVADLLSDMNC